jgi:hypothetical protein
MKAMPTEPKQTPSHPTMDPPRILLPSIYLHRQSASKNPPKNHRIYAPESQVFLAIQGFQSKHLSVQPPRYQSFRYH